MPHNSSPSNTLVGFVFLNGTSPVFQEMLWKTSTWHRLPQSHWFQQRS